MDFFDFLQTPAGIVLISMIGIIWLSTSVTESWSKHWRAVRLAKAATDLKIAMIQRGMNAEEIERILEAGTSDDPDDSGATPTGAFFKLKSSAILAMIEQGADSAGIVKVIEAGLPVDDSINDVARLMAEQGYEGEDIARVVAALRLVGPTREGRIEEIPRPLPEIELEVREPRAATGV